MESKKEKTIEKSETDATTSTNSSLIPFENLRLANKGKTYIISKSYKLKGRIDNPFNPLPQYMFKIKNLKEADLSSNRQAGFKTHILEFVPIELTKLHSLRTLNLDFNSITSLPEEIGDLKQLEVLTVTQNKLTYLPDSIITLRYLKSLHLSQNHFRNFPLAICYMKALRFLDISMNKITEIPEQIQNLNLTLETLILLDNELKGIPESLCKCINLQTLWLASNQIKVLPKNFRSLKKLDWTTDDQCCIDGNPMENPPMKICKLGIKEIIKYLEKH